MGSLAHAPGDGSTPSLRPAPLGVVLAGGASRRMGSDKALVVLGGESLVARAARHLAEAVGEVVVADRGRGYLPGLPAVADGPGRGPAAGLLGAAAAHPGRPLLALACDLPAVPVALLALLASLTAYDAAFPAGSRGAEPLCALWGPPALQLLGQRVASGRFALHGTLEDPALRVHRLGPEALAPFGDPELLFRNLNRPEDLAGSW